MSEKENTVPSIEIEITESNDNSPESPKGPPNFVDPLSASFLNTSIDSISDSVLIKNKDGLSPKSRKKLDLDSEPAIFSKIDEKEISVERIVEKLDFFSKIVQKIDQFFFTESFEGSFVNNSIPRFLFFPSRVEQRFHEFSLNDFQIHFFRFYIFNILFIYLPNDIFLLLTTKFHWIYVLNLAFISNLFLYNIFLSFIFPRCKIFFKPIYVKINFLVLFVLICGLSLVNMFINKKENNRLLFYIVISVVSLNCFSISHFFVLYMLFLVCFYVVESLNPHNKNILFFSAEILQFFILGVVVLLFGRKYQILGRKSFISKFSLEKNKKKLQVEISKIDALLNNLLPRKIVERLKLYDDSKFVSQSEEIIHDEYKNVTTVFVKIWDFEKIEKMLTALQLVELLNQVFSSFDTMLSEKRSLYRIKTIAEKYMFCGGLPKKDDYNLTNSLNMCFKLLITVHKKKFCEKLLGFPISVAIGLNCGDVIGGVVPNLKHPSFDVFGDSINCASRMCTTAPFCGCVQITEKIFKRLQLIYKSRFVFSGRRIIIKNQELLIKGKGIMNCYTLQLDFSEKIDSRLLNRMEIIDAAEFDMNSFLQSKVKSRQVGKRKSSLSLLQGFSSLMDGEMDQTTSFQNLIELMDKESDIQFDVEMIIQEKKEKKEEKSGVLKRGVEIIEEMRIENQCETCEELIVNSTKKLINYFSISFRNTELRMLYEKKKIKRNISKNRRVLVFAFVFYMFLIVFDVLKKVNNSIDYSYFEIFLFRYIISIPLIFITSFVIFTKFYKRALKVFTFLSFFGFFFSIFFSYYFLENGFELESFSFIVLMFFLTNLGGFFFITKVFIFIVTFCLFLAVHFYKFQLKNGIENYIGVLIVTILMCVISGNNEYKGRKIFLMKILKIVEQERLDISKRRTIELLNLCLPIEIVNKLLLKRGKDQLKNQIIADQFENVSVLFSDVYQFTFWSSKVSSKTIVETISEIFTHFDNVCEKYGLTRVKIIGDAYCCAGNATENLKEHEKSIALFSLSMLEYISNYKKQPIEFRIGVHVGPCVGGLIGHSRFSFDLFGRTIRICEHIEQTGVKSQIHVSKEFKNSYCHKHHFTKVPYEFKKRSDRKIVIDNEEVESYFLVMKKKVTKLFSKKKKKSKTKNKDKTAHDYYFQPRKNIKRRYSSPLLPPPNKTTRFVQLE